MTTVLRDMQKTVIKYAEVISKVLRVDVEIVDSELFRIAGTGMFENCINENMEEEGHVYSEVMRTGERQIIMEPGEHPICNYCYKQGNCDETFEMSMPIKIDDEVIGVIGFVCFTEKQKSHILDNLFIFTEFLEQITDLISSKIKEEFEKEKMRISIDILRDILNRVEQGVIVVDEYNKIESINNMGMDIIDINQSFKSIDYIVETGSEILNFTEFELSVNSKKYLLLGEEYKVPKSVSTYNKVYLFTDINRLENLNTSLSTSKENLSLNTILGESEEIISLKSKVKKIGNSISTVLITGESGTGKELFARAIHIESIRKENPFVTINCAAIPDSLLESELFGYVKGAFTGADPKGKMGKIEFANTGTLFLDEIGDMPIYLQSKLLRIIEEKEIVRLGSNEGIKVDVRIIAATNKDLEELIRENRFREDLYYRLNVIPFEILPLRKRKDDIKTMTYFFIDKYAKLFGKGRVILEEQVFDVLYNYNWPGNVRELENAIEYTMNMIRPNSIVKVKDLPKNIVKEINDLDNSLLLEDMERKYIEKALKIYEKDTDAKQKASEELGIGIATLYRKIKRYGLN